LSKTRVEAFSDGVVAIIITIMVLALVPPKGATVDDLLRELGLVFVSYVLSFANVGIFWNNHHHLFQAVRVVNGSVLWANLFLLFWLSLIPFATGWMGETSFAMLPVALYGVVLLFAGIAYFVLVRVLIRCQPPEARLAEAIGRDVKGKVSPILYAIAIPIAFVAPAVSFGLYVLVAVIWFVPDRRIENRLTS
jgi:uncharacterized membrane protein